MKLAFCTDIHLNHLKPAAAREFLVSIAAAKPDAIVSCGDMSEAPDLSTHLGWAAQILDGVPFYYVLGNHDFYRESIRVVRASFLGPAKCQRYLTHAGPPPLPPSATLLRATGWSDEEYGNWTRAL